MPRMRGRNVNLTERRRQTYAYIDEAERDHREYEAAVKATIEVWKFSLPELGLKFIDKMNSPTISDRDFIDGIKVITKVTGMELAAAIPKDKEIHEMNLDEVQRAISDLKRRRQIDATAIEVHASQPIDIFE